MLEIQLNVKGFIKDNNLTQTILAEELGLLQSQVSQQSNPNRNMINKGFLEKIINTYGITDISKLIKIVER